MFQDSITVFHLNDETDEYEKQYFEDLYFDHTKGVSIERLGEQSNNSGTIIIPTEKEIAIYEKDIVIEGKIEDDLDQDKRLSYLKSKYTVYEVVAVDDLRKGDLPHYEIEVK